MHGKQNGSVCQKVTLGRSDVAPVSLLAEDRAGALECCLDCKHGDHSPHLHPTHTVRLPGRVRGFGPRRRPGILAAQGDLLRTQVEGCVLACGPGCSGRFDELARTLRTRFL